MFFGFNSIIPRGFFLRDHGWKPDVNRTGKDDFDAVVEVRFLGNGYPPKPANGGREN